MATPQPQPSQPTPKPSIDWRRSQAKNIILGDLDQGILSTDEDVLSAEETWTTCYSKVWEFRHVPFKQFKARLKDHRAQYKNNLARAMDEDIALNHDRGIHPRRFHNNRGEPVFDLSVAKALLQQDVEDGVHLTMTPAELQGSQSNEYGIFNANKFKERIYQEVRRKKMIHYLGIDRAEEKQKALQA
jgi:hypothetical protein